MRINQFIAQSTGISRRAADKAIIEKRVTVNSHLARLGEDVKSDDIIMLDQARVQYKPERQTIMLNKPAGYVCSRSEQGNRTIYDLIPEELHDLKPVGRLDKDSTGLLIMTTDGDLAYKLTHPKFKKLKIYLAELDKPLKPQDQRSIETGVELSDGISKLKLRAHDKSWQVSMTEGRNRQIRRSFDKLGYTVVRLHRTDFGNYSLNSLRPGTWQKL